MFKTEWTHKTVTLTEEQQAKLDREIADISEQLEVASDLIFHTVVLTDDWNGPIIIVDAEDNNKDTLFLTYYENPEWTTLDDTN
jgi:prolyl-tRNA editing enzyme YbaK/EbsC (Cys-tRNA(Pro) deacylase)